METKAVRCLFVIFVILIADVFCGGIPDTFGADKIEFKTVYPGVYDKDEQAVIDAMNEICSSDPEELAENMKAQKAGKAPVGIILGKEQEIKGTLGWENGTAFSGGLKEFTFGTNDLLFTSYIVNPYNPLYTDPEYSKNAKGRFIAAPFVAETITGFPHMPSKGDAIKIFVIDDSYGIGGGLDHEVTFHKPIYAGDTLHSIVTEQSITDVSDPNGSKIRKIRFIGEIEVYNQKNELVITERPTCIEKYKHFKDPAMAELYDGPFTFVPSRYHPEGFWDKLRPRHVYTEADWDYIKDLWSKEYIRGADTLYWEDVNIGDEPTWTCSAWPYQSGWTPGIVEGDNVLIQQYQEPNSIREVLMDPKANVQDELTKNTFGEYQVKSGEGMMSPAEGHPNARPSFQNSGGRNVAARLVTNWMGDDGWLYKFAWRLAFCMDDGRNQFPAEHDRPSYLLKVPYLKEQGKFMNTHGYEGDIAITKAYVCDKYVKDDHHYVDLVVWNETIEGDIWTEAYAVVELPSRGQK